ncbi:unnamed protein product [Phytophthora fragariaefolia]|uniref:Unnamed protein product n=1 Tax=Phytophthora fragariaefolia TaxID=1490495 RepID=A0A9W6TWX5_9STRA|nr:unnamed protein product [Phytophthora fragariaefolia]
MVAQLAKQVEEVQAQQREIDRSVDRLDAASEAHRGDLEKIRHHTTELQLVMQEAEDRHRRAVVPRIQRLDDSTEQLQQALDQAKTAAATSEAALRTLSAKFHSSAGAFASQLEQQYRHFELTTAVLLFNNNLLFQQIVQEKAPRLEIDTRLATLNHKVGTKASDAAHKTLASSVKGLHSQCEKLQEHVELSTRFLDWFAHRGEAYEHNLELVEAQLGRLAQVSHPQGREPFGGHVRFPRSP